VTRAEGRPRQPLPFAISSQARPVAAISSFGQNPVYERSR
jgi:hypothetical protein